MIPGIGTIVNTAAVIVGGLLGLVFKNLIGERIRRIMIVALALSIVAMSVSGFVSKMLVIGEEGVSTRGTYMLIFSLVIGGILGELVDIDGKLDRFGNFLKAKTGSAKDPNFVEGFVTCSLTVCVGAMAIMGSILDGVGHDPTILFTKSILDFVLVMAMSSSLGKGCIFSAIPIALLQGSVTALSALIAPLLSDLAMDNLSLVGSVLILAIGVNLLGDGKFRIKVANLLPSVVLAVAAAYIPFLA